MNTNMFINKIKRRGLNQDYLFTIWHIYTSMYYNI